MRFGFFTAALNDRPVEEVARFAAEAGFETLELDVGRHIGDLSRARSVVETVRGEGLDVCAFACGPSLMNADHGAQERTRATVRAAVEAAAEAGVGVVVTFPGRDDSLSEDDNYRRLADVYADLAERAASGNVKVVWENWPGPRNAFLGTTPAGWTRVFELAPAPNLGLNFDPSHLIRIGVDPVPAVRAVADRLFLTHAKDTEIFADRLQQVGYHGHGWWTYRLPGHGTLDWTAWLGLLRELGYDGVVSVEHEDNNYGFPGGALPPRQEGLREALRVLREALPDR